MIKRKGVGSTARKPLVDISNGGKLSRISKKKNTTDDVVDGAGALDLLLLARSELSNLFGQIDELVALALENKRTDRKASQDVESFRNVLSDIHSSLKPWVSRLRQAFIGSSAAGENQPAHTKDTKPASHAIKIEEEDAFSFNNRIEPDLMVSPSPLVSWRTGACAGGYALETGKQLFSLTPVPKSPVKVLHDNKNLHATLELAQSTSESNDISEGKNDFSDDALKDLTSKYQELLSSKRKEVDLTLDWFLSPPKTCRIMEPTDEKPLPTPTVLFLATPCNDLESTVRKGGRAGESTLKKELWTRFDEVSKDGLHFDASVFKNTERKGFLDMLEEACEGSESECGGDV